MRVAGGELRGRRLEAPPGRAVRPTSDRLREAVFDILAHAAWAPEGGLVPSTAVADVFAGTGALGIEALSRGAASALFLDSDGAVLDLLRRNLAALGLEARARALRGDATRPPRAPAPADLLFLDPPYGSGLAGPALAALERAGWTRPGSIAVLELGRRDDPAQPEGWTILDDRSYGDTRVLFVRRE